MMNKLKSTSVMMLTLLCLTTTVGMNGDCEGGGDVMMPTGGGNGGNNGGGGTGGGGGTDSINPLAGLSVVLTGLNAEGDIRVDEDLIVIGTGQNSGIEYIFPSEGNTPMNVTNFGTLETTGFNVANGWIAARAFSGDVTFHDTSDGTTINVDEADLALPSGAAISTDFWADGNFMVAVANVNRVDDGHKIKFIDCSGATPQIVSFTQDIPDQQGTTQEKVLLDIDADRMEVVALQLDVFYRYDMTDPNAAPEVFDFSADGGVTNATEFHYDNGKVIYHARETTNDFRRLTYIADLDAGTTTMLSENPSGIWDVHLTNGVFGYFVNETDDDVISNNISRSVWGTVNGSIVFTDTHETDVLISEERTDGLIGYGQTLAATPDGEYRFLAGGGSQGNANYLQVSRNGSAFVVVPSLPEFANIDPDGLEASEVVANNSICAFRTLTNNQVAFIVLP